MRRVRDAMGLCGVLCGWGVVWYKIGRYEWNLAEERGRVGSEEWIVIM